MNDKLIEAINLPKRIIDDAEIFMRKLFGAAIKETGELFADQIKYRRFKNQVVIFTKAKNLLESKKMNPKQINLKNLVPLIEYSSLEEDENLQNIWANVIANISSYDSEPSFNLKCIEILKEITWNEIFFLDFFFIKNQNDEMNYNKEHIEKPLHTIYDVGYFRYRVSQFLNDLHMTKDQGYMYVDRLISFGLIKYEDPILLYDKKQKSQPYELKPSWKIQFTSFGLYFVKLCKYDLSNS